MIDFSHFATLPFLYQMLEEDREMRKIYFFWYIEINFLRILIFVLFWLYKYVSRIKLGITFLLLITYMKSTYLEA